MSLPLHPFSYYQDFQEGGSSYRSTMFKEARRYGGEQNRSRSSGSGLHEKLIKSVPIFCFSFAFSMHLLSFLIHIGIVNPRLSKVLRPKSYCLTSFKNWGLILQNKGHLFIVCVHNMM